MSGEKVALTEAEREALRTSGSWPNVGSDIFAAIERIKADADAAAYARGRADAEAEWAAKVETE